MTIVGTLLGAWLIPAFTRQWNDQRQAQELKAEIVTRIGRDTAEALVLSSFITSGRFREDPSEPILIPTQRFNDLDLEWERDAREIESQLEAYFGNTAIVREWNAYAALVQDTYWLITKRAWKRKSAVARLKEILPIELHCEAESLRRPYQGTSSDRAPEGCLAKPRQKYVFVSRALIRAKSSVTEDILRADPVGLSTDTSDLLQDLLPFL